MEPNGSSRTASLGGHRIGRLRHAGGLLPGGCAVSSSGRTVPRLHSHDASRARPSVSRDRGNIVRIRIIVKNKVRTYPRPFPPSCGEGQGRVWCDGGEELTCEAQVSPLPSGRGRSTAPGEGCAFSGKGMPSALPLSHTGEGGRSSSLAFSGAGPTLRLSAPHPQPSPQGAAPRAQVCPRSRIGCVLRDHG